MENVLPKRMWVLLGCWTLGSVGCAVNLAETRPAKVLDPGEVQVSMANNIVLPVRVLGDTIDAGESAAEQVDSGQDPTDAQVRDIVGGAAATALTGVGYGSHLDAAVGLGYQLDLAGRLSNGIYALSLRRGFQLGRWDGSVGLRVGYNSGASWFSYLNDLNEYVKVASTTRMDGQAFTMLGREFGEWGRIWFGAKAMLSPYEVEVDGTELNIGKDTASDLLAHYGGFAGVALGYKWVHVLAELTMMYAVGEVESFGYSYDLSGLVIAPSWGVQVTF